MGTERKNLFDKETLEPLLTSLHRLTELPVGMVLAEDLLEGTPGKSVVAGTPEVCARWHMEHPACRKRCRREARELFLGEWEKEPVRRLCALGLRTFVAPVKVRGRCEALLFAHAFFLEGDDPDHPRFARQARLYGFPKEPYRRALHQVPVFSPLRLEVLLDHLVQLMALLAERGHLRASLDDTERLLTLVGEGQNPKTYPGRRLLDAVASRFSHEMRTPLAAIRVHAERQLRRLQQEVPWDRKDLEASLQDIHSSVERLEGLIRRSPLSWGEVESEELRSLDLEELVRDAWRLVDLARGEPSSPRLELDVAATPEVRGVSHRLFQVFVNLLHNAWNAIRRAGADPGLVVVRSRRMAQEVEIVVEDDGEGFPPGDRSRLLLPLFHGGPDQAGIGLSIVASLLADQGGGLELQDRLPRGGRVVIRLPLPCENASAGDPRPWPAL